MNVASDTKRVILAPHAAFHPGCYDVVRIIARLNVGGPALHVINLATAAGRRELLVTGEVAAGELDMTADAVAAGVHVLRISELGPSVRPGQDLIAAYKLYRLLRAVRPAIVHTHTAKAGALGRVTALLAGVPIRVHTFHGHVFQGYFSPAVARVILVAERLLARCTTCILSVSDSQLEELAGVYRIASRDKIHTVPLGLRLGPLMQADTADREAFRTELDVGTATLITVVGRLVPIKNHRLFVEAAELLLRRGLDCVFAIVGDGPEAQSLKAFVDSRTIQDRFRFCGWRRDLARVYAGTDIIALTSNNEGTPVCLIEALAACKPIVATDVGGVRDLLEDGANGLLIPPGDPHAFAGALERLITNPEMAAELGHRGVEVARRYSAERLAADIAILYSRLRAGPIRPVIASGARTD